MDMPHPDPAPDFTVMFGDAVAFLKDVAPNWKCAVCANEAITLYVTQPDGSIPAHVRLNAEGGGLTAFRSFAAICDRCGHVHQFDLAPFLNWRKARVAS